MNRKSEELKEKQISEVMLSIENRVRHAYNQGYEQGLKDSKQEPCEQIKWERDTAIKQLNELGYGLGEKIEPCEDCISRKALLDAIYQKEYGTDYYDGNMLNIPYIDLIKQMPSSSGKPNKSENPTGSTTKKCATCAYREIDGKPHEMCKSCVCGNRYKQEPKTGHWNRKTKVDAYDIEGVKTWGIKCQCDRCYFTIIVIEDFGYYKYCPNCGSKMESESRNEV